MAETPPDKLQGWLEREEEEFGITGAISRTIDWDSARNMLKQELGYEPSDAQIELMMSAGRYRYSEMPQVGVRTEVMTYKWGQQLFYRDIATGRRVGLADVTKRLEDIGLR